MHEENEYEATLTRHAAHFLKWASEANTLYIKGNENILVGLTHFRFIWVHLYAAYERLLPAQKVRPQSADRWLSDFPGRCVYVLDLHLPPREKIFILQSALEAARRLEDKQDEGVHLGNLGIAYADLGEARKAIEFYEQRIKIAREIGDRRGEGNALGNLGLAYADLGEARKAIEFYEQRIKIAREIGDRRGEGNALGNLGNAYAALGEARKAIEFYEQALIIDREIGDRRGEGADLGNLGNAYAALGEARKAIEFYEQHL
ncbi:MAG: tetratricopeptide repeat protein [Anaerolineales bacterium]|nr:tetratricopeptide repeat protein [Anaerolineales bacterium]